ncbi:hypothetical protein IJI91_03875 [Candidatus Saccharibacteria bacterium]|nr:hypothetical protein [Candidatus Saccharibacteria bacterium]
MKLKIGDKVYLQKYEVAHIIHELNGFPGGILDETFGGDEGNSFFFMNGPTDGFRFECVYKEHENVKWLMEQDWIVDYDEYAEMSLAELRALQKRLKAERSADIDEFNAKDEVYRETHFDEQSDKFDKLGHKIASLGDLIRFRKGEIKFGFPGEYQGKTAISGASSATSTPQKKPGFFARLFGRGAQ